MVEKFSGWSENFLDGLKTFQMVWKVFGWSGKFLDGLENFPKHVYVAKKLHTFLRICRKNVYVAKKDLRSFFLRI